MSPIHYSRLNLHCRDVKQGGLSSFSGPVNWVFRAGRDNVADPLSRYPLDTLTALLSAPRISPGKDDDVQIWLSSILSLLLCLQ
jgi:hypothetical protein